MASLGAVKIPIFARIAGKDIEIGELTYDLRVTPSGKVISPTPRDLAKAVKKAKLY